MFSNLLSYPSTHIYHHAQQSKTTDVLEHAGSRKLDRHFAMCLMGFAYVLEHVQLAIVKYILNVLSPLTTSMPEQTLSTKK